MSHDPKQELECQEVARAIWDYLDGRSDMIDLDLVEKHLDGCSPCLDHMGFERRLKEELSKIFCKHSDPEGLRERVKAALASAKAAG